MLDCMVGALFDSELPLHVEIGKLVGWMINFDQDLFTSEQGHEVAS